MRNDAAQILIGMGYEVDKDFLAVFVPGMGVVVRWLSQSPQPTEAEIEAAALPVLAALEQTRLDGLADEQSRQRAKAAHTQLQTIVDGIDGATLAQAKTAIKQIAQISQDLIRATVGR